MEDHHKTAGIVNRTGVWGFWPFRSQAPVLDVTGRGGVGIAMMVRLLLLLCVYSLISCNEASDSRPHPDDLSGYLARINYGETDSDAWVEPDSKKLDRFSAVFQAFLSADYDRANRLGKEIGYEVVRYPDVKAGNSHHVLRETHSFGEKGFVGGGTYVLNPLGLDLVIEVPHPVKDAFTATEGIQTYLQLPARLLMLAGTVRDASSRLSNCSDGHYRASDAAHQTSSFFYTAHTVANDSDDHLVFLQLHGFGSRTLARLQQQCGTSNDRLINLSVGFQSLAGGRAESLLNPLAEALEKVGSIEVCLYGRDTTSLGGTWNVEGRYSNRSIEPCTVSATQATGRFIHFEQSYRVREDYRWEVFKSVAKALERFDEP